MATRSRRLRFHIGASRLHRWLALVIGVQLLLWFTSGLVMSLLPIEQVRGEHLVDRETVVPLPAGIRYAPLEPVLAQAGAPVRRLQHRMLLGRPVLELETASGETRLYDARTGVRVAPIGPAEVQAIATAAYRGKIVAPPAIDRITSASTEFKGRVPVWRAVFADDDATRVYIDDSGRIVAVRTATWRLYDFFWGLHIMDWSEHENFNTPWIKAFAFGGLALAIAGTVLLYFRWPRRKRKKSEG